MREFAFIDLFAGIGGFRIACERESGACVFSSEIDRFSCETYERNFREKPSGNISKIDAEDIPGFDLLCAGFPCQSFSTAGKRMGLKDARGTLIYEIVRILREKMPGAFLLENVPGLLSHDGGETFRIIRKMLGRTFNGRNEFFLDSDNLGYNVFYKILNSADFGLAQNRRRLFLVGFRTDLRDWGKFRFPSGFDSSKVLADIIEDDPDSKYFLSDREIRKVERWGAEKKAGSSKADESGKTNTIIGNYSVRAQGMTYFVDRKRNGKLLEGRRIVGRNQKSGTLLTSQKTSFQFNQSYLYVDEKGGTVLPELAHKTKKTYGTLSYQISDVSGKVRIFTPRECARLQGFPEWFRPHENDKQAYKQFGNAVSPPVIREIIKNIKKVLEKNR